jgi:hypothetical protein
MPTNQGHEARMGKGIRPESVPRPTSYKIGYVKRVILQAVAMPLLAIAGVLGLAAALAAGQNLSIGMSDPYEQFSPELEQRDITLFTRVLQLSPAEAQAVQALYDGYYNGLREKARELSEKTEAALEEAQTLGDQARARLPRDDYEATTKRMTTEFLQELQSMLTAQQAGRWPVAEREMRRRKRIGSGQYPGENVDVVRLVEDVAAEAVHREQIAALLEQYAAQLDAAMQTRDSFVESNGQRFMELIETDPGAAERMFAESQRNRLSVRDINRQYVAQIATLLPDAERVALQKAMFKQTYGFACEPSRSERFILAAPKIAGLRDDVRTQIEAIVAGYEPRRDALLRRACEEEEKVRLAAKPHALAVKMGLRPLYEDQERFNGRPAVDPDHPLQQAKRERLEHDRATRKRIESLLTVEQRESIPNDVRGSAAFEQITEPWL